LPGREWRSADGDGDWLLASTTLVAPPATLPEATPGETEDSDSPGAPGAAPGAQPSAKPAESAARRPAAPATGTATCGPTPDRRTSRKAAIRLTRRALVIQQRIDAAALRRLNAANAWIEEGVTEADLCGGAFAPGAFSGEVTWAGTQATVTGPPSPRPLRVARGARRPGEVTLSVRQVRINDRISRALHRRAVATAERLRDLTGGNLAAGTVIDDRALLEGLAATGIRRAGVDLPARRLMLGKSPKGGALRLTSAQLRRTQRRSQRAITIANRVSDTIARGLTEREFRPGSIGTDRVTAESP
jgi:hypothetical protein